MNFVKPIIRKNYTPTCFNNPKNYSCMNLVLTNKQERFLQTKNVETGRSDVHKMVFSVFKTGSKSKSQRWSHIVAINVLKLKNSGKVS